MTTDQKPQCPFYKNNRQMSWTFCILEEGHKEDHRQSSAVVQASGEWKTAKWRLRQNRMPRKAVIAQ